MNTSNAIDLHLSDLIVLRFSFRERRTYNSIFASAVNNFRGRSIIFGKELT